MSAAVARFAAPLVKAPPLKKMTKELSRATNRTFNRLPPAPAASVVAVGAGAALRSVYYGGGKGGGGPGGFSSGTARTVALAASAVRARNYAAAARAAFCGTAAHMGGSRAQKVDLAAIGHGALDLLGFIPGIGAADVANGLWYAAEGNYVDAAASLFSAIPGVGDAFGGANAARKAVKTGLNAFEAASSTVSVGKVIKSNKAGTLRAIKTPDGSIDLVLKKKELWNDQQISEGLQKARDASRADTVKTKSSRGSISASQTYRNVYGPDSVPHGYDVDHIIDLQLGGKDNVTNMRPMDRSVNRSMGAQISYLIRELPEGTRIGNVRFE